MKRDTTLLILRTARRTARALLSDMRDARRWGNQHELRMMHRFLVKMVRGLPDLYAYVASVHTNPPAEELEAILKHMRELVRVHKANADDVLVAIPHATETTRKQLTQGISMASEKLALTLRNLRTKAKRLGPWSEALDEEFEDFMRVRRR